MTITPIDKITQKRIMDLMQKRIDEAFMRLVNHRPDQLDEKMAERGWRWNPLANDWERFR